METFPNGPNSPKAQAESNENGSNEIEPSPMNPPLVPPRPTRSPFHNCAPVNVHETPTEAEEYFSTYYRNGEWWLAFLEKTDEKARTLNILWALLYPRLVGRHTLRILDIGAGNGILSIGLATKLIQKRITPEIDVVEPSPALQKALLRNVRQACLSCCLRYSFADRYERVSLEDESYDIILCIGSIYGITSGGKFLSPIAAMARILSRSGFLVLIVQTENSPYKAVQHRLFGNRYSTSSLLSSLHIDRLIQQAGALELIHSREFYTSLYLDLPASPSGVSPATAQVLSLVAKADFRAIAPSYQAYILSAVRSALSGAPPALALRNKLYLLVRKDHAG